jgi:hypothetical protein
MDTKGTKETALYFPYIQVPSTTWFTQVLLYWDAAASIVPYRERDKTKFSPYMSQLIKAGLLHTIKANDAFQKNADTFDQGFLRMLDSRKPRLPDSRQETRIGKGELSRPLLKELGERRLARVHREPVYSYTDDEGYETVIHQNKAPAELFEELGNRGLAYRRPTTTRHVGGGGQWWVMEKSTSDLYMAYLVGSICRINPGFYPVTDTSQTLADLAQPTENTSSRLAELRYATIMDALPMPSQPVTPSQLVEFKDQKDNENRLHLLRNHLNRQLADVVNEEDEYLRQVKMQGIQQEIHDEVEVLTERMSRQPWPRIILGGVAGVVAAGLTVGAVIATGGGALALGLGIGGAIAAGGQAGYQVADVIRPSRLATRSPLAYAVLAGGL